MQDFINPNNAILILAEPSQDIDINITGNDISNVSKAIEVDLLKTKIYNTEDNEVNINISNNRLDNIFDLNFIENETNPNGDFNAEAAAIILNIVSKSSNVNISDNKLKDIIALNFIDADIKDGNFNSETMGIDVNINSENSTVNISANELESIIAANIIENLTILNEISEIETLIESNLTEEAVGINIDINNGNSILNISNNKIDTILSANNYNEINNFALANVEKADVSFRGTGIKLNIPSLETLKLSGNEFSTMHTGVFLKNIPFNEDFKNKTIVENDFDLLIDENRLKF